MRAALWLALRGLGGLFQGEGESSPMERGLLASGVDHHKKRDLSCAKVSDPPLRQLY